MPGYSAHHAVLIDRDIDESHIRCSLRKNRDGSLVTACRLEMVQDDGKHHFAMRADSLRKREIGRGIVAIGLRKNQVQPNGASVTQFV